MDEKEKRYPPLDALEEPSLWIDWSKKIVSLHSVDGYEEKHFPTKEEAVSFAVTLTRNGFLVQ